MPQHRAINDYTFSSNYFMNEYVFKQAYVEVLAKYKKRNHNLKEKMHLPIRAINQVVLQTNQVDAFASHSPKWMHGFQELHTIFLDRPSADSLMNINGGPQHAVPNHNTRKRKKKTSSKLFALQLKKLIIDFTRSKYNKIF